MLKNRRAKLEPFFERYGLDAILFSNLLNVRYLCGFSGSEGALLLTREAAWLLCDSRYTTQAAQETSDTEIRQFFEKYEAIGTLLKEQALGRIGFEAAHVTVGAFKDLSGKIQEGSELVAIGAELDQIRSCKDTNEIEELAAIAGLASDALLAIIPMIRPGVSESFIARELEFEMRRRGAEGRAFDFIVASGERGAMPHGRASEKLIKAGELVTVDYGAALAGYYSDETVTLAVGQPGSRSREIYDIVKEAHDRAIAAVRPGIACRELDAVARGYIQERGYGDYFGHGLGHGVGLEIHEKPVISPRSEAMAEEGMVFTIEPGIYIPGFGGVRIEDTVAVTADGCRLLTQVSKKLMII
ncbi:Xaa-Pro peptidase family protein [Geobacter sp. SVR]|uniref:M24 family metallopeptidase n=1 Tax=Geobacter sp. SVR TaxID=2495594 RepID=UPI00143EFE09|nr:Xaa-Pro peptidase family protein [Geobacter sp. SVR]BCS54278.1 integrase [Geobacter sp. SVR]GCF85863.1 integrase [Geobacter sp. SVR]